MQVILPNVWYKIEQRQKGMPKAEWVHCLWGGKHVYCTHLWQAKEILQDNQRYPHSEEYRIVRVSEEVVCQVTSPGTMFQYPHPSTYPTKP